MQPTATTGTKIENKGAHSARTKLQSTLVKIRLFTSFDKGIYGLICRFKKDKGLSHEQDVIRLAVAFFLEKNGYTLPKE